MKTITRLFLVGLIAFGMTACSNEDEIQVEGKAESTVSIKVVPSSNGPVVRSIGDLTSDLVTESAIKTLEVYVFRVDGTPDGYGVAKSDDGVSSVEKIATHSGSKNIYVVANASIGPVASETDLNAKTNILPTDITEGLPMTAAPILAANLKIGHNQYGYAEVTDVNNLSTSALKLQRINARVALINAKMGQVSAGQQALFDELSEIEVAMFNVPQSSMMFPASLAINEDFIYGEEWPTNDSYTKDVLDTAFKANPSPLTWPITNLSAPYFYVNENTSSEANEQMIIVLKAKPLKDGETVILDGVWTDSEGYTYYPIWVNADLPGYLYVDHTANSQVLRNTQYNISLTINGLGNPSIDPVELSTLDVLVEVAPWTVVDQSVIW